MSMPVERFLKQLHGQTAATEHDHISSVHQIILKPRFLSYPVSKGACRT
jgi:hypothetical protein